MLSIPVKLDLDAGAAEAALKNFEKGAKDALSEIVELGGKKVNLDFKFTTSGDPVVKELNDQEAALKKVTDGYNRLTGGQAASIGRTKKIIQQFKAERDALAVNSKGYKEAAETVKRFEGQLRSLQGIQSGSIADLKNQRAELIGLRDATAINSPEFKKLTGEIQKFDKQLAATKPKANSFVQAFAKIAIVSAGIQAVGGALRSVGNAVDVYVRRTKDVEGFQLALENVGLAQGEVSRLFAQAETTATNLGAPLAQVEQTYKRMVPALQAVGTSAADSDKFIENISARTQTLGLNTEQSGRLLEAFAQVLSKGKLQAEELNQQISELDGAFRVQFADALGVTTEALNDLISNSQITAEVFVDTVNKMENGAEALKQRILDGTATIQQFQNQISTIETKNIEAIGAAIQPAIKSFLQLRLAVAEFIKEFAKSAQFDALVGIFNSVAKAADQFASALLDLIGFIGQLLSPLVRVIDFVLSLDAGIGNLVTILIKVAATIATVTLAIKGIVALQAGIKFVQLQFTNLAAAITGTGAAAATSTPSMLTYEAAVAKTGFAALNTAGKLRVLALAAGKLILITAVVSVIDALIKNFTGAGKAAAEMNKRFSSIKLDFKDKLEELNNELDKSPEKLNKLGTSLEGSIKSTKQAGDNARALGLTLSAVGILAAGASLALISGGTSLVAATAAVAGTSLAAKGAVDSLAKSTELLEKSDRGRAFLESQREIGDMIKANEEKVKALGFEVGQVDFSTFRGAGEDVVEFSRRMQAQANTLKENIAANEELIRVESARDKPSKELIARTKLLIQADKQKLALTNRSAQAASAYVVELIKQGNASAETAASTEELKKATEQMLGELDSEVIKQQTAAIEEYGKKADAANLLAAANIGIASEATEQRIELYDKELAKLNEKEQREGVLLEGDKKRQIELTNLIAKETKKQAELGVQARDAVIDAFEEGIDRANAKVDTLGKGADALKGAFDGVTDSLVSGLSAASSLIDAVVSREIEGLEQGSAKRQAIITKQLKAQAVANATENSIAQLRLSVQNKVAQSEARIAQIRLQAEAAVAASRGNQDAAAALNTAAQAQDQVIAGLQMQYQLESQTLDLQKKAKDQQLIQKGLSEEIGSNEDEVARKIGVQVISLDKAIKAQQKISDLAKGYATQLSNSAIAAQNLKEAAAGTVMDQGQQNAEKIRDALGDANGAAEGLNTVMQNVDGTFNNVNSSAERIVGTLEAAVSEANKLISISNTGSPARAMGGPVTGGQQYTVNDGGGREAFLSNTGKFSMLPAARNIQWTAPSSGTIISAKVLKAMQRNQRHNAAISSAKTDQTMNPKVMVNAAVTSDSGRLAQQISSAMSGSTSNRITNNVTIQSQSPVTDASDLMTNVARMRLRNARKI